MRIALVLPGGGGGGGARVIVRFAQGLRDRGHDVRILYPYQRVSLRERLREAYVGLRYGHRQDWLRTYAGPVHAYMHLTPEVVGSNDVVVGIGVDSVLAIADLPETCGIKIYNSHGTEPWIPERMQQAWRIPMPRIVSASYLEPLMRQQGSTDPIFVVHNGVDQDEYYPVLSGELRRGVGTVYHGGSPKDPATVLSVMHKIHQARPDVPLYVFGAFPRPAQLPPAATYVRLPALQDARDLYCRSQVWFCGSRHEGFGLPLLEAMACGCAVVSTDCGGPADIIEPGVTGRLTPVGDADALAERILELLQDAARRESFVAAGRAKLDNFTWPGVVRQYEQALQSIVDMRHSAGLARNAGPDKVAGGSPTWSSGPGTGSAARTS